MFYAVLKKELIHFIRDKKSLISFFIVPIILYVYIFNIEGFITHVADRASKNKSSQYKFQIIVSKGEENHELIQKLKTADRRMEISIAEKREGNNEFDLVVEFPKGFSEALKSGKSIEVNTYRKTTEVMDENYTKIENVINAYGKELVRDRLASKGIDIKILESYPIEKVNVSNVSEKQLGFFYALPMCILLFPLSIGMQLVNELCATEKERGTLEILMTTKAKRSTLLGAKYATMLILVLAEIIISLLAFVVISKNAKTELINVNTLTTSNIFIMIGMVILTYISISLIQFMIGLYAKNFKEAQAYMTVLLFTVMLLNYLFIFIDIKNISYAFLNLPIVNAIAVLNEILLGILNIKHLLIVGAWLIFYTVALAFYGTRVVFKESVLLRR